LEGGIIVRDCQEYLSWLCAMMHEMHHSVLLAQWSAEVRHTLTLGAFFGVSINVSFSY
jgi:hypothetical protein